MRRAILVTTGAVVGAASVIAYKPSERMAVSGLSVTSLTPASANTPTTAQTPTPTTPTTTAAPAATTATTTRATATPRATATHRARKRRARAKVAVHRARPSRRTRATQKPKARATAASTPRATATSSGPFANADGTYRSATQQVVSHGRYYGDATISVTVRSGHITAINFNETGGNFQFADAVNQYLVPEIIRQQKVSVGIVSGATGSSMALVNGLNSVLR